MSTANRSGSIQKFELTPLEIPDASKVLRVDEGYFGIAEHTAERPYLSTFGLWTCKGLALYNLDSSKGLLAHIAYFTNAKKGLKPAVDLMFDMFEDDPSTTTVSVLANMPGNPRLWARMRSIIDAVETHRPREINANSRPTVTATKDIALDLSNGQICKLKEPDWNWYDGAVIRAPIHYRIPQATEN